MRLSNKILIICLLVPLYAFALDNLNLLIDKKQMSIYKLTNKDKNTTSGIGVFYTTDNMKLKIERSDSAFKTGAILKANPFQNPMYVTVGGNYINEKIQQTNLPINTINQYSGALAVGYSLNNNLCLEMGENVSQLNGSQISENSHINNSISKEIYLQLGKRFETPVGTIDTHMNSSQIYNTLSTKEENYESSVNYYLDDAIKIGYFYNVNQNEISNGCSINLSYFSTAYTKDITQDSYNITLGIKANFTDITKLSTYKPSNKLKKNLSKSHKFDNIILQKNMHLRK